LTAIARFRSSGVDRPSRRFQNRVSNSYERNLIEFVNPSELGTSLDITPQFKTNHHRAAQYDQKRSEHVGLLAPEENAKVQGPVPFAGWPVGPRHS
jgi:hypothetical protein